MLDKSHRWDRYVYTAIIILYMGLLLWVGVTDETKDDLSLELTVSGKEGISGFIHPWSSFVRIMVIFALHHMIPGIAWNYMLLTMMTLVSTLILSSIVLKKFPGMPGGILCLFMTAVFYFQTVATMNYSRTAALVMCAGAGLIVMARGKREVFLGILVYVCGSVLRLQVVALGVGFLLLIVLWLGCGDGINKEGLSAAFRKKGLPFLIAIVVSVGILVAGNAYKETVREWSVLRERNTISEQLLDYPLKSYEENEDAYCAIGITANDMEMISSRMTNSDTEYFTNEKCKLLTDNFGLRWSTDIGKAELIAWGKQLVKYLARDWFPWLVIGVLLTTFFTLRGMEKWFLVLDIGGLGIYLILFCYMGRVVDRVCFSLYLWAAMTVLFCVKQKTVSAGEEAEKDPESNGRKFSKALLPVVGSFVVLFTIWGGVHYRHAIQEDTAKVFAYMEDHPQNFYFYTGISQCRAVDNLLLESRYYDTQNAFYSSDFMDCPKDFHKLSVYGMENIYRDCVDAENIYFIDNDKMQIIETYIREHYHAKARAVVVGNVAGRNIYHFVSMGDEH